MAPAAVNAPLPRITIQFCTQCKWMLRAAYFAQELLSTFSTAIGEVALQPSTGGTFTVELFYVPPEITPEDPTFHVQHHVLWDRKAEGGFPETKELKRRVRDILQPGRDLGHVDGKKKSVGATAESKELREEVETTDGGEERERPREHVEEQDQPLRRPRAISRLQGQEGIVTERKFTPMDVDGIEMKDEKGEGDNGIKRNPDGTICEDCN